MKPSKLNLGLLTDPEIFEVIHDTKKQFVDLFTEVSNNLDSSRLKDIYPSSKGVKISMGNELQKCPYQVLDVFRDFDKKKGHNIRILNWWGHGLYVFVFFGKHLATQTLAHQDYFKKLGYGLAKGSSPWDYGRILDLPISGEPGEDESIETHLLKFGYLQWFKNIKLDEDIEKLHLEISDQLDQIFHFHRI